MSTKNTWTREQNLAGKLTHFYKSFSSLVDSPHTPWKLCHHSRRFLFIRSLNARFPVTMAQKRQPVPEELTDLRTRVEEASLTSGVRKQRQLASYDTTIAKSLAQHFMYEHLIHLPNTRAFITFLSQIERSEPPRDHVLNISPTRMQLVSDRTGVPTPVCWLQSVWSYQLYFWNWA